MEVIGAIDQGTQSTRFFLFDSSCRPIASHQVDLTQHYPSPGWCEHNPLEIWSSVKECILETLKAAEASVGAVKVRGLGITNQRETVLLWDRHTGQPLHNAVVWHDNRTSDLCAQMEAQLGGKDSLRSLTGLPISTYFSAFKFAWLYEQVPDVKAAVDSGRAMFGTIDTWLIYMLTGGDKGGVHVTDVTNASRTMLMDLRTCTWHTTLLETFHVNPAILPKIVSNSEVYGHVAEGPLSGVPICGCLGDQQAAMLGQRCVPGELKNTYGTGCFLLLHTGPKPLTSRHGLLTTVAYRLGKEAETQYALEGAMAVAGMGISWLRDKLGVLSSAAESEELANSVSSTKGVYFVPAFSGLLAPYWRPDARGVLIGITASTTRAHVVRAMLESMCFRTREMLEAMKADWGDDIAVVRADGGASANNLLMQLQADILQGPVLRPNFKETTSLGAALAAGLAVGFWTEDDVFGGSRKADGLKNKSSTHVTFQPAVSAEFADRRFGCWKKAVERCLDLADLAEPEDDETALN